MSQVAPGQLVNYIVLSDHEVSDIEGLLDQIFAGQPTVEPASFYMEARLYSQELPRSVRRFFYDFTLKESSVAVCVKGNPMDDARIGPTPTQLPAKGQEPAISREEALHILYSSLLGESIGWTTQQGGRVVNEIIPIKENEDKLISSGSAKLFDLHTEDAFHPYAADYIGLMCLRNPDGVPTIAASLANVRLEDDVVQVLFEPRFMVGANPAHTVVQPKDRIPVFFGAKEAPYLRVNLNLQGPADNNDEEARRALDALSAQLATNIVDVALEPGDYFYLDNFRAAHGRKPYTPRYDGTDRWLKRLTITSYLRKSRDLRDHPESRMIKPTNAL